MVAVRGYDAKREASADEFLFTMDTERVRVMEITQHSTVCVNVTS